MMLWYKSSDGNLIQLSAAHALAVQGHVQNRRVDEGLGVLLIDRGNLGPAAELDRGPETWARQVFDELCKWLDLGPVPGALVFDVRVKVGPRPETAAPSRLVSA